MISSLASFSMDSRTKHAMPHAHDMMHEPQKTFQTSDSMQIENEPQRTLLEMVNEKYPTLGHYGVGDFEPEPTQNHPFAQPQVSFGEGSKIEENRSYAPPTHDSEVGGDMACLGKVKSIAMLPNRHGKNSEGSEDAHDFCAEI